MGTVTIGAVTYDIYGTLAGATDYLAGRLNTTAWDAASSTNKSKALVTATRMLDRTTWQGEPTSSGQALAWPRTGVYCNGVAVDSATVPTNIIEGSYELANLMLANAEIEASTDAGSNIKRVQAGTAEVEYFRPTSGTNDVGRFPTVVQELVGCYMSGGGAAAIGVPYASGTTETSSFSEQYPYELYRGFA